LGIKIIGAAELILRNERGPICIGPLNLFLLLALGVSLIAMLASILGMLLGICRMFLALSMVAFAVMLNCSAVRFGQRSRDVRRLCYARPEPLGFSKLGV
jgi:hypothetical protein